MTPPIPAEARTAAGPPPSVRVAINLFIAHVVLGVLGAILSLALIGQIVEVALRRAGVPAPQDEAEAAVRFVVGVIVALMLSRLHLPHLPDARQQELGANRTDRTECVSRLVMRS